MRKTYNKPEMDIQQFEAQEFCSTCINDKKSIVVTCNANPVGDDEYILCYLWGNADMHYQKLNDADGDYDNDFHYSCGEEFTLDTETAFKGYYTSSYADFGGSVEVWIQPTAEGTQVQFDALPSSPHYKIAHPYHVTTDDLTVTRS